MRGLASEGVTFDRLETKKTLTKTKRFRPGGEETKLAVQARLIRARILFRQLRGGREHQKVVQAEMRRDDGQIVKLEAAQFVPWHELPDDVREKFIRRQTASVEMELSLKE